MLVALLHGTSFGKHPSTFDAFLPLYTQLAQTAFPSQLYRDMALRNDQALLATFEGLLQEGLVGYVSVG